VIRCREVQILRDAWRCAFDFETRRGEWIGVVGPSGAGKSTLLETIVGFVTPDSGEILIDGNDVSAVAPARRRVAYMFQQDSLFGHLTVETNLALALHDQNLDRQTVRQRVGAALNDIGLDPDHGRRKPSELSGGERARINLARALLRDAAVRDARNDVAPASPTRPHDTVRHPSHR
jgi:ABC-type thiamine transport system ATPase subunit